VLFSLESELEVFIIHPYQEYDKKQEKEYKFEETSSFTTVVWAIHLVF